MANPILNDKTIEEARAGWAAPQGTSTGGATWAPPAPGSAAGVSGAAFEQSTTVPPITDGAVSPWTGGMTIGGTINKTLILFALLLASAAFGWSQVEQTTDFFGNSTTTFPPFAMAGVAVGFIAAIAVGFKPQLAKILGPIYALGFGFVVGAVSAVYNIQFDGIVVQAAGATLAVFAVMLGLYRTGVIKVTEKFRTVVTVATLGVMAFYLVSFVVSLFGANIRFFDSPSPLGIGISVLVAGLAALNLTLDFDFIERGSKAGLAKDFEWYAAFGLTVTIVWLYLELLRLFAKLQQR